VFGSLAMCAYDINLCFVSVISCDNFLREPVLVVCIKVITLYNTLRRANTISSLYVGYTERINYLCHLLQEAGEELPTKEERRRGLPVSSNHLMDISFDKRVLMRSLLCLDCLIVLLRSRIVCMN